MHHPVSTSKIRVETEPPRSEFFVARLHLPPNPPLSAGITFPARSRRSVGHVAASRQEPHTHPLFLVPPPFSSFSPSSSSRTDTGKSKAPFGHFSLSCNPLNWSVGYVPASRQEPHTPAFWSPTIFLIFSFIFSKNSFFGGIFPVQPCVERLALAKPFLVTSHFPPGSQIILKHPPCFGPFLSLILLIQLNTKITSCHSLIILCLSI